MTTLVQGDHELGEVDAHVTRGKRSTLAGGIPGRRAPDQVVVQVPTSLVADPMDAADLRLRLDDGIVCRLQVFRTEWMGTAWRVFAYLEPLSR